VWSGQLSVRCHSRFVKADRLGTVPVDIERSQIQRLIMGTIEISLILGACFLGLALAIFFLTFNITHRHERYETNRVALGSICPTFSYIKLSSPKLNNVMLIGTMHIHVSCLLFALDDWFLQHEVLGQACMVRVRWFREQHASLYVLVAYLVVLGRFFLSIWFDVAENVACPSYFYFT
jgi:hypothetical protein